MSDTQPYQLPSEPVGLTGPVERPAPGTLPLRADLAHIALAGRYLAAHYVVPVVRCIGGTETNVYLRPRGDAEKVTSLPAGSRFEVLDFVGEWVWGCCGPEGPSGFVRAHCVSDPGLADPAG